MLNFYGETISKSRVLFNFTVNRKLQKDDIIIIIIIIIVIIIISVCNLDSNCTNTFIAVTFFQFRRKTIWPTKQILLVFCQIYFMPAAVTDFNWMETTALILCVTLLNFVSLNFYLISLGPAECGLRQPLSLLAILLSRAALFAFFVLSD